MNDFFAGVFTSEDISSIPVLDFRHTGPQLADIHISSQLVETKLQRLKPTCAPGPDEVHPQVLQELGHSIAYPLSLLYCRSMDSGKLPAIWKQGMVVPIYKKGDKLNTKNYRPVSLTSVPCKVLELIIRDELMEHLTSHGLLSHDQHGFCPRRSCNTQLLATIDAWSRILENNTPVDAIYLDFQRAFDSVPFRIKGCCTS